MVGESLVDIVHGADGQTTEYAGGSAANVAVALARLGRPVRFATAWADDERGGVLAEHLSRAGVELASDPHVLARTATAAATIGADGAASYEFDLEWRIGEVDRGHAGVRAPVLARCGPRAGRRPGPRPGARAAGAATVSYDVNARPAITGTGPDLVALVERTVAVADLVKASDEDLASLYPDLDLAEAAAAPAHARRRRRSS